MRVPESPSQTKLDTVEPDHPPLGPEGSLDPWGRVMIAQPPPSLDRLPLSLKTLLVTGTADGVSRHTGADGRPLIAWVRRTELGTRVETYQPLPDDEATYLEVSGGDPDSARLLQKTAREWNEDLCHFVEDLGLSPSVARSELLRINGEVFRTVLEATAVFFASTLSLPKFHLPPTRARPSLRLEPPKEGLMGTAQFPKTGPWKPNLDGARRTVEEAKAILAKVGVELPEDITIRVVKDGTSTIPEGAYAAYKLYPKGERMNLDSLYDSKTDSVVVFVKESVFESDEAIVAILAHETHEIQGLTEILAREGSLAIEQVLALIAPGRPGNLHDAAWDIGDRLVRLMRGSQ